jgi:uncharacterized protein YecE (DUF72 family)
VGTAGWAIPRDPAGRVGDEGTRLERYAGLFPGVEINSTFYRSHLARTYCRWAETTPGHFRFALKVPRVITHDQRLGAAREPLERFLDETAGLSAKRGPLLVQLPPSLAFDAHVAAEFFELVRSRYDGAVACEPRHVTWFSPAADALLVRHHIARVAADPAPAGPAMTPGGWTRLAYYRLHGSPRTYWSRYDATTIDAFADRLLATPVSCEVWCIFDNTASGAAFENAWELRERLARPDPGT